MDNAGGTQTCKYGDPSGSVPGYDDLGRLIKVDCSASVWQQNFSYDPFGNLTKTVPTGGTGIAWNPGYNATNNRYTLTGTSYDANGNLLSDTFHTYTWDTEGHSINIGSSACGTNGTCAIYDAFGSIVEKNVAGVYNQFLYSPVGKLGLMNGQTLVNAYIPLPGGEIFNVAPGYARFWHRDWLGTIRLSSLRNNRTVDYDRAFAPFGETYKNFGSTGNNSFTGDTQDTITGTYDTLNRELHPSQGRWLSPDPLGIGAVDLGTPQTWNRYAYVGNSPLSATDPLGLDYCLDNNCPGGAAGGAGGDGGYLYNSAQFGAGDIMMDGQAVEGWLGQAALRAGLGIWGPANAGRAQTNANGNGSYTLNATVGGGWAWTNNRTGEELSPESAAEIGLATPGDDAFTAAQRGAVEAAVRRATKELERNKQCAALFHQAGAATLANTSYNGMWSANGSPAASTAEDSRSVGINVNGSFFGPADRAYLGFLRPGGITLGIMQQVVIWHELGHELASLTGFMADGPGDEFGTVKSWVNTLRVLNNCVKQ